MKKIFADALFSLLPLLLTGCAVGDKMTSMTVIYAVTTVCALLLFIGYCFIIRKKEGWFLLLFASVFVVNAGYFLLSVSETLDGALMANRVAYLGSVFLPISMLMIIRNVCRIKYSTWFASLALAIGAVVFLVAASPDIVDIYYKSVTLETVNGVAVLNKEYGPWHSLYFIYLLLCFGTMIATIIYASMRKKISSATHAAILLVAVFVNIAVWLLEQLVKIDFEFLSVSYIITELFLLGIYAMMQNLRISDGSLQRKKQCSKQSAPPEEEDEALCNHFHAQLPCLTPTERVIYDLYLDGKGTKEILQELNITENTLKYHNKNIYSKLGIKSRKQLLLIASQMKK